MWFGLVVGCDLVVGVCVCVCVCVLCFSGSDAWLWFSLVVGCDLVLPSWGVGVCFVSQAQMDQHIRVACGMESI